MKNFFKKIKSYGFWVSLSSALVLLVTALGNAFGFEIENKIIEDIVMSVAGVLAVFGIVSMNNISSENNSVDQDASDEEDNVEIVENDDLEEKESFDHKQNDSNE